MSVLTSEPMAADVRALSPGGLTPARQAYRLLYLAFIAAPIIAGLDKFRGAIPIYDDQTVVVLRVL